MQPGVARMRVNRTGHDFGVSSRRAGSQPDHYDFLAILLLAAQCSVRAFREGPARGADCLTEPGISFVEPLPVALFGLAALHATVQLYEAREGVSAPLPGLSRKAAALVQPFSAFLPFLSILASYLRCVIKTENSTTPAAASCTPLMTSPRKRNPQVTATTGMRLMCAEAVPAGMRVMAQL